MTIESKNKLLMFLAIFAAMIFLGFATFGLERLLRPNQNNRELHGEIAVYLPGSIPLETAQSTVRELSRLGPTFHLAPYSTVADVVVTTNYANTCSSAGFHRLGTRTATINTNCVHSPEMMQLVLMHEIGHVLGMTHVCRNAVSLDSCSPVGFGPSFMNPVIEEGWSDDLVPNRGLQYEVTSLDIAEYRRTRN